MKIEPKAVHKEVLYPTVRVRTKKAGGSGTVLWSQEVDDEYVTFVLTNHHVIADVINVGEKYDPLVGRKIPRETRGTVTVEFFKYKYGSRNIGTYSVEADVVAYEDEQDIALLKLRNIEQAEYVAKLPPPERTKEIQLLDEVYAVGAALGHPPLMTTGHINYMDDEIDEYEYWLTNAQVSFGNSGGSVYLKETHEFIGIPSRVAVALVGFGTSPIDHMAYFIPFWRVYKWLEEQYYTFIFDDSVTYEQCDEARTQAKEEQQRLVDVYEAQKHKVGTSFTNRYYDAKSIIDDIDRMADK
ncbi:MAG: S1 family peptidase [Planctomycetota bacterium]|jgi:hypothetical protein